jgi:hypothetical protein
VRNREIVEEQGVIVKNTDDRYLGGKLLDPKVLDEVEQEYYAAKREGKSPYSPEAQKIIAVDEKIEQEKKKQAGQQSAAVKTANDQALVQQSTGVAPPASKKDEAQQAFEEAENKRLAVYDNLSPAEQAEVAYYEERKQMDEWRKTANDPSKSPAEQSDARQELRDAQEFEDLNQQEIVVRRMAEDAGIDSSGDVLVDNGIPTIGGVALDPREFHKKRIDFEEGMANHGDPLSTKSRAYALAAIDARKKERAIKKGAAAKTDEKAAVAAKNDEALQQQAGLKPGEKPAADGAMPAADSAAPTTAGEPDKTAPAAKQASDAKSKPAASAADSWYSSIAKKVAQVAGAALGASVQDAKQVSAETKNGVAAAQTTAITSRNVNPATAGAGGEKTQKLTINGTLSLQGLNEAILNGRGSQPVAAEGAGSPVVVDPPISPIDGMRPELT